MLRGIVPTISALAREIPAAPVSQVWRTLSVAAGRSDPDDDITDALRQAFTDTPLKRQEGSFGALEDDLGRDIFDELDDLSPKPESQSARMSSVDQVLQDVLAKQASQMGSSDPLGDPFDGLFTDPTLPQQSQGVGMKVKSSA